MNRKICFFVIIAALLCICSCTTVNNAATGRTVSVSGTGSVAVKADIVSFSISVSETESTTGLAQQVANKKISQILGILRSFDIDDKDITTSSLNFSSQYRWEDGEQVKIGEEVSQVLYVRMKDIDRFAALVDELGANVSGVSFYGVSFGADDYTKAYDEARKLAYEDAFEKASMYAQCAGLEIGEATSIEDGGMSTSSRYSNIDAKFAAALDESTSYSTEVPAGNLNVSVSCNVVFELK